MDNGHRPLQTSHQEEKNVPLLMVVYDMDH